MGRFSGTTSGFCTGNVHVNLVAVPRALASEFRDFCELNPGACPLVEQTEPGNVAPGCAPDADLRTDLPRYRVFREGELSSEPLEVTADWRADLVSFLIGCSFNFEQDLVRAGIAIRHQEEAKIVPMFITNRACHPVGSFSGPIVVSMRPIPAARVDDVRDLTCARDLAHGAPIHIGDPRQLGIDSIERPDFGNAVSLRSDEVPAFWECGVTPQAVVGYARPSLMVTHAPGHMFVTDLRIETGVVRAPGS